MASVSSSGTSATFVDYFEKLALNGVALAPFQGQLKTLYPNEDPQTMLDLFELASKARQNDWEGVGKKWLEFKSRDNALLDRISPIFLRLLDVKKINLPEASFEALKRTAKNQTLESPPAFSHPTPAATVAYESLNMRARPYITQLRNRELAIETFREAADKLTQLMAIEAEAALPQTSISIETPLASASGTCIQKKVVLLPILRSGLALLHTFLQHFPSSRVGMIGMKRNEKTAIAQCYLDNLPEMTSEDRVIILEPMIATGGSLSSSLALLVSKGIKPEQIIIVSFIAAPQGLLRLRKEFPDAKIIVAQIDVTLNEHKFIVPGLGDFGDRYYGT